MPSTYEIYIDLRPATPPADSAAPEEPGLWTLSGALTSRGAQSVGSTVPLENPPAQNPPNRLRKKNRFLAIFRRYE